MEMIIMNDKYYEEYSNYVLSDIGFLKEEELFDLGISYEDYMCLDDDTLYKLELYKRKK